MGALEKIEFVELQNVVTANDAQHFFIRQSQYLVGSEESATSMSLKASVLRDYLCQCQSLSHVIVDLTCTDISPDRAEKNSADTSSEHPTLVGYHSCL